MHSTTEYAPPAAARSGRPFAVAGLVCAVVAVFLLPIVLGPAAVALGAVAQRRGDQLGRWVVVAGVVGTVLGFALGALVFASTKSGALATLHVAAS